MADLTIDPTLVAVVRAYKELTGPLEETVAVGQMVRFSTTTGKFTKANASSAAEARVKGMLISKNGAGSVGTVLVDGIVELGAAVDGLTYDDDVFLSDTDGVLADGAGTVSVIVGQTISGFGETTPDKLLHLRLG